MSEWRLDTPVVFLIFNRPDTTEKVFAEIARVRPRRLLVVGDGPRQSHAGDAEKVAAARSVVTRVDWDCEVATEFAANNLGLKVRVSSGLDWVFGLVDRAIVLEDDCRPSLSFFRYCEDLLGRYADDERVFSISGDNFQNGRHPERESYYFSRFAHVWGWATWRRVWKQYDLTMSTWPALRDAGWLARQFDTAAEVRYWTRIFDAAYADEIDTWDYQLFFTALRTGGLTALPAVNLVSNIGFRRDATHIKYRNPILEIAAGELGFPLSHPEGVTRDVQADRFTNASLFARPPLRRIASGLRREVHGFGSTSV